MTSVKRSIHARKKRRATLELAKGYRGDASRHYRTAKEAVLKADQYRYRDRRNRKRDFRRLWITRINAAARLNGLSYSQFMHGLSSPASSSTARSSRTSPSATPTPSDALPTAPARRWRPAEHSDRPPSTATRAPLQRGGRPFL